MGISNQILTEINDNINKINLLERKKVSSLTVGEIYIIHKIVPLTTRFGKTLLITLCDKTASAAPFQSFLPKRVADNLSDETIEIMNKSEGGYTLTYLGQSAPVFLGGGSRAIINFGCLQE